jgi:hypothetical protein
MRTIGRCARKGIFGLAENKQGKICPHTGDKHTGNLHTDNLHRDATHNDCDSVTDSRNGRKRNLAWRNRHGLLILCSLALVCALGFSLYVGVDRALAQAATDETQPEYPQHPAVDAETLSPFVPGEITVGVGDDFVLPADNRAFGLTVLEAFPMTEGLYTAGNADAPTKQTLLLQTEPGSELAEMDRLAALPGVHFALPNWTVYAADMEPWVADPWLEINDPLYESEQWYAQRIHAVRGWATALEQLGSLEHLARVRVAVIDSGVDFSHPDLAGRLMSGWNYVTPGTPPQDDYGHGTHMTGLIAANFNNGQGLVGLAPQVEILPYRTLNQDGAGSMTNVATAIQAAANSNARIINLSLYLNNSHPLLEDAVRHADARGSLLIAAAGNCVAGVPCPTPVRYPAVYPEVLAVGATTIQDVRASYSAVGPELDLVAPGGSVAARILSTWPLEETLRCGAQNFRLEDGAAYCYSTGTSSATALVSGGAALLFSLQPQLSAADVRAILVETAQPLVQPESEVGAGRLNLRTAIRRLVPANLTIEPARVGHSAFTGPMLAANDGQMGIAQAEIPEPQLTAWGDESRTLAPIGPPKAITRTLTLANPSLTPMIWEATLQSGASWLSIEGPSSGLARFESPGLLTVVISPTAQMSGRYHGQVRVQGTRPDGTRTIHFIPVQLDILPAASLRVFFPIAEGLVNGGQLPGAAPALESAFAWAMPAPGQTRTVYGLTGDSATSVPLPFAVNFKGRTFTDFRLASNGYISFPAAETDPGSLNRCLSDLIRPSHVVAGWWGDLDPGAPQSQVSTFVTAAGEFVVEFFAVPLRGQSTARVSFQIVLVPDGPIRLNYLRTPSRAFMAEQRPPTTVGIAAQYGRFYRQLYCGRDAILTGELPQSGQSFVFQARDVY